MKKQFCLILRSEFKRLSLFLQKFDKFTPSVRFIRSILYKTYCTVFRDGR